MATKKETPSIQATTMAPGMVPRWEPGQQGNPNGGSRASRMCTLVTRALREKLAAIDPITKKTYAERLSDILMDCAVNPDPEVDKTRIMAIDQIIDRCEGKAKQQIDVNDITKDLRERSDADLMFYMQNMRWPEDPETKVQ